MAAPIGALGRFGDVYKACVAGQAANVFGSPFQKQGIPDPDHHVVQLASDVFSGKCKGFGFVEMEGHEARKAIAALDGKVVGEKSLRVQFENPKGKGGKRPRR